MLSPGILSDFEVITNQGKVYYKMGQLFGITNWGRSYYKLGQLSYYKLGQALLQIGAGITN